MATPYSFRLVTPLGKVFESDDVESITAPGEAGRLGVLANHAPMVSGLMAGALTVTRTGGNTEVYFMHEGVLQVTDIDVIVLADYAEGVESIDAAKARVAERAASDA